VVLRLISKWLLAEMKMVGCITPSHPRKARCSRRSCPTHLSARSIRPLVAEVVQERMRARVCGRYASTGA